MIKSTKLTKDEFVAILKEAGLTEEQMLAFHQTFEKRAPDAHQEFLEYLQIDGKEIVHIRSL